MVDALKQAVERGTTFGASTEMEITLAKMISDAITSIEMIRFVNSGTEATMLALRLTRVFTGRDKIEAICLEYIRYGYRRVTHELRYRECHVNHKKVLKIMRESDLLCRVRRRWVKATDSRHRFPRYPNLIKEMSISRLNQVWLSDITYILPLEGQALSTWRR